MKYKISVKEKTKKETDFPFAMMFLEFSTPLILLLTDTDHTLWPDRNASLLVLKDLKPSKSEKTNRPSLGILQKEILGYLFSQRKKLLGWSCCQTGHTDRTTQFIACSSEQTSIKSCAILSLIDYTLKMMWVPDINRVGQSKKMEGCI